MQRQNTPHCANFDRLIILSTSRTRLAGEIQIFRATERKPGPKIRAVKTLRACRWLLSKEVILRDGSIFKMADGPLDQSTGARVVETYRQTVIGLCSYSATSFATVHGKNYGPECS